MFTSSSGWFSCSSGSACTVTLILQGDSPPSAFIVVYCTSFNLCAIRRRGVSMMKSCTCSALLLGLGDFPVRLLAIPVFGGSSPATAELLFWPLFPGERATYGTGDVVRGSGDSCSKPILSRAILFSCS